jgi:hypothetical protein
MSASGILTLLRFNILDFFGNLDFKFSEEEKLLYFENFYLRTAMFVGLGGEKLSFIGLWLTGFVLIPCLKQVPSDTSCTVSPCSTRKKTCATLFIRGESL